MQRSVQIYTQVTVFFIVQIVLNAKCVTTFTLTANDRDFGSLVLQCSVHRIARSIMQHDENVDM